MEEVEGGSSSGEERESRRAELEPKEESCDSPELCAVMVGPSSSRQPVLLFSAFTVRDLPGPLTSPLQGPFKLTFKMSGESVRIVRTILFTHGFTEVAMSSTNFNLTWMGGVAKPHMIRQLRPHQKINHFPRCTELTRKDKLCENVRKMQHSKGSKHFNIIPTTFILPGDANRFLATYRKQRGTWIVKPSTLSRGRGISLINHPNQLPRNGEMVISKYIENPLCIDGFKFDLRLYVAVTSYDPLRIYLFEDGLTRFATVRYAGASMELDNRCMHLTNYSVNKHSVDYIACTDPNVEDYGNKWSLSGLLRHLHGEGVDTTELMMRVEDVIIKTILCSHEQIASACRLFMPHRGSCFELFGFDVLIDDTLRPWVLEVNLSPSLACDAPLDLRIKSNLIADLFSLAGVAVRDPVNGEIPKAARKAQARSSHRQSSGVLMSREGLTSEEAAVVRETKEEYARRGSFVRIFPTADSWDLYGSFLDTKSSLNFIVHKHLYPESVKSSKPTVTSLTTIIERRLHGHRHQGITSEVRLHEQPTGLDPIQRSLLYTKKLTWYSKQRSVNSFTSPAASGVTRHRLGSSRKIGVGGVRRSSTSAIPGHVTNKVDHVTNTVVDHVTDAVDHVISNITKLSKFQVRQIFATYLECVQKRLVRETNSLASIRTGIRAEDQSVDVVVEFLKRASANLRAPFTVIVPNHKLPLRERRRMLAKQLAEFVMLYRKETLEVASVEEVANAGPALSSDVLRSFLHQASEEDLESALGAYAKQTHSSTVFLDSSTKPPVTTPTSSIPPPTESAQARHTHKSSTSGHTGKTEPTASSVSQRVERTGSENTSKENIPSHFTAPARYAWLSDRAADDESLLPQYSNDMLQSSDLPLDSKRSLDMLTRSLQAVGRVSSAKHSSIRARTSSSRLSLHKRSMSVQSLASTTSSIDSDMSEMSGGRGRYPSGGSHYRTTSATSLTRSPGDRLKSASVIVSKEKPYISPYSQSVLRPKQQKTKVKSAKNRLAPHPPLHPAGSVESIAHALNRLTQRQNARKYAAHRPVVSALKAASQPSPLSAQPPSTSGGENSREQENERPLADIDYRVLASNSNHSNSREYSAPVPSYTIGSSHPHQSLMSATSDNSNWRTYRSFLSNTPSAKFMPDNQSDNYYTASHDHPSHLHLAGKLLTGSQVTPEINHSHPNHNNTHSLSFHATTLPSRGGASDSGGGGTNPSYGTSGASTQDLFQRIQLHNRAISHYMQAHRQHQSSDMSHSPHARRPPTPTSSLSQSNYITSTPSFKFVVPHPPTSPKPHNFSCRSHRGIVNSTTIS